MNPDPHRVWIDINEDGDSDGVSITGTRPAFEQLRDAVHKALDGPDETVVVVGEGNLFISGLKIISEVPEPVLPSNRQRFKDAVVRNGCLLFIVAFLLCAGFGLVQLTTLILQ